MVGTVSIRIGTIAAAWAAALLIWAVVLVALTAIPNEGIDATAPEFYPAPPAVEAVLGNERWVERGLLDPLPERSGDVRHEAQDVPKSEPFFEVGM